MSERLWALNIAAMRTLRGHAMNLSNTQLHETFNAGFTAEYWMVLQSGYQNYWALYILARLNSVDVATA